MLQSPLNEKPEKPFGHDHDSCTELSSLLSEHFDEEHLYPIDHYLDFDQYGIIRDVIQNHLLQLLMLLAMEPPVAMEGPKGSL